MDWIACTRTALRAGAAARRRLGAGAALAVLLLASGCAVTPETRHSLDAYTQAMQQVDQSAQVFLDEYGERVRQQAEKQRIAQGGTVAPLEEYPGQFVLPGSASQSPEDQAIAKTRHALRVVRAYNEALVALAEGRSLQEVRQDTVGFATQLQALASMAGAAIPGIAAFTAVGPSVIKLAQDAWNRQQLADAVRNGREAVDTILAELAAQVPPMYTVSVVATSQEQDELRAAMKRLGGGLAAVAQRHAPPTDGNLAADLSAMQAQLGDMGRHTRTVAVLPIALKFTAGRPVYDNGAHAEAQVYLQSMSAAADRYAGLVARQNAGHAALARYVAALGQARTSLGALAASFDQPVNLALEAERLLRSAFELREAMIAYRRPMAASMAR